MKPFNTWIDNILSCFLSSGADSQRARLHQDIRPLSAGATTDAGGAGQRPVFPPRRPQTNRRLRLPHLRPLGEERGAAEPGRPLSKHS